MRRLFTTTAAGSTSEANTQIPHQTATETSPVPRTSPGSSSAGHTQGRPTSRRDDPNHPLAPRGVQTDGRWEHLPHIQFYSMPHEGAELEYEEVVSPPLLSLLRSLEYTSYSIALAYAGYSRNQTVPVVIVIAGEFKVEHAKEVMSVFDSTERHYITEVFCYQGDTKGYVEGEDLQVPQQRVNCGYSIGPSTSVRGANPNASSSLGFYIRLEGDDHMYATTVHHALGKNVSPVPLDSSPQIKIQQPSSRDFARQIADLEKEIEEAKAKKSDLLVPVKVLKANLANMRKFDANFASVVASAFGIVDVNGHNVSEDWLVMRVNHDRVGVNYVRASVAGGIPGVRDVVWTPRDSCGVFVKGVDDVRKGMYVRKAGRGTGDTVGRIQFAHAHAKLEGNPAETREWTIVTSVFSDARIFAENSDSGAAVVNRMGDLVGVVLGGVSGKPIELKGHENLGKIYVTYVTPAPFVLQQIEKVFGREVSVEHVDLETIPGIIKGIEINDDDDSD